jgi:hypothetical protein
LSLNAQGVFDHLLRGRTEKGRKVAHGVFEVYSLPFSTAQVLSHDVRTTAIVPDEQ